MLSHSLLYKQRIERNKLLARLATLKGRAKSSKVDKDFFGSSYNVMIGHNHYPNVSVGLLSVDEPNEEYDNPFIWKAKQYGIPQIIGLRSSLINSHFSNHVKSFDQRLTAISQEVSLSSKPVDVEINLQKKPTAGFSSGSRIMPYGPSVKVEKATITENTKIPQKVDKLVNDDMKAVEAVTSLYEKGFDEHYLTKILSMGNVGMKVERKLVPTKWSITATDDMLGKNIISQIKDSALMDYSVFLGGHMGNMYIIAILPDLWSYELFEIDLKSSEYGTDYEPFTGRKSYAMETAGGYYASRLAVLEELKKRKRQASVLCLRFISSDYWMSVGVWVVREATRSAMSGKPMVLESREQLLRYITLFAKKQFGIDIRAILSKSKLLDQITKQKKITEFTSSSA